MLFSLAGEDVDYVSEGEESGTGGGGGSVVPITSGYEAVDLRASRSSQHQPGGANQSSEPSDELPMEEDEEECTGESIDDDEEGSRKQMRNRQDAENNNSFVEGSGTTPTSGGGGAGGHFAPAGTSHVTLEALQNTKVAVAQFAATALAGGADSEAALQDLALLQSTLYTLQHQQVFQLQLISQLQQQLSITHTQPPGAAGAGQPSSAVSATSGEATDSNETSPSPVLSNNAKSLQMVATTAVALNSPPPSRPPSSHHQQQQQQQLEQASPTGVTRDFLQQDNSVPATSCSPLSVQPLQASNSSAPSSAAPAISSSNSVQMPMTHQMPAMCSISSSLASSIITNNDPPPLNEPNTLEMLQKRAQEVLDNASQGLLANNLADELAFRSGKGSRLSPYDSKSGGGRGEPFFKHRCRYCGKVFGSDSALQIHIR